MFKIKRIALDDGVFYDFYDDYTVVYGTNSTGKSVLFKIIYYMLGSSKGWDERSVWELDGMDGVTSITMEVDNGKRLYLKRNKSEELFYKNNTEDDYLKVDIDVYKDSIQSMLISSTDCFNLYHEVVGEKLSHRALSYLNFIDQYGLGNAVHIFLQSTDYKYTKRIRKQMQFIFDSSRQKELAQLEEQRDNVALALEQQNEIIIKRRIIEDQINTELSFLEIENPDSIADKKSKFLEFCKNRTEKTDPINKEYTYLLNVSNQLANQIQIERTFSKQRDLINSRNKKNELLLQLLKNSIGDNEEFSNYLKSINKTLEFLSNEDDVLSMKDYSASIAAIAEKKEEVDSLIQQLKRSFSEKTEFEISNSIKALDYYFKKYNALNEAGDLSSLEEKKKDLDKRIKTLAAGISANKSADLNSFITNSYINMPGDLPFVKEDLERSGFSLEFIPSQTATIGKEKETIVTEDGQKEVDVEFIPGSKARQTCWQIITFIGIHSFAKRIYPSLPLIPLIVIDGINEPFDDKFPIILNYLSKLCSDNNIQLICTSTKMVDGHVVDLSNGLNPSHR